jgi:hypothetical protein
MSCLRRVPEFVPCISCTETGNLDWNCIKLRPLKFSSIFHSINGENAHYGTPTNPCAPDRVPGGSSSGSAVAVAAKLVDFALGQQPLALSFCVSGC